MAAKNTRSGKKSKVPLMVRCPDDVGDAIRSFCDGRDITPALLARVGLRFCLKELLSGRACIVNGELQPVHPTK
jgi:hypothetical protein